VGLVVVVARVAQDENRRAARDVLASGRGNSTTRARNRVAVEGDDVGLGVDRATVSRVVHALEELGHLVEAVDNTKLRTLENCELMACTRWSVKRAKDATDPEMSADEDLAWPGRWLEAQVDRYAAGGEAATHVCEGQPDRDDDVGDGAPVARQFATQRSKRALELGHLVSIGVHDVEVFGSGLRTDLARASDPRSSTRRSRITRSISAFSISMRERASRERVAGRAGRRRRILRETPLEVLEVEVAQRSIEVIVPPTGRPAPTRVAGDRFAGGETKRLAIRSRSARKSSSASSWALSELTRRRLRRATVPSTRPGGTFSLHLVGVDVVHELRAASTTRRKEDLEGGVEDRHVVAVFHQRRGHDSSPAPVREVDHLHGLGESTCSLWRSECPRREVRR